jgi:putative redox protein
MATIESIYLGELRTEATHVFSGTQLITDAPLDNQGKAETFSPSDLLTASLGSCMMTIMGIAAREHGINIDGTKCSLVKIMGTDPRRVVEIQVVLTFPNSAYTEKEKAILERSALTCPVAKSLHPDLVQNVRFVYGEE